MKTNTPPTALLLTLAALYVLFSTPGWAMSTSPKENPADTLQSFEYQSNRQIENSSQETNKDLSTISAFAQDHKIDISSLVLFNDRANEIWIQLLHCASGDAMLAKKFYAEGVEFFSKHCIARSAV